ncbi:hypothetical protein FRC11_005276 [Ceratobasidium sp. 423]|nr:hypothetical protein FRC11_005276 [Ceratobasidium sp. 423]
MHLTLRLHPRRVHRGDEGDSYCSLRRARRVYPARTHLASTSVHQRRAPTNTSQRPRRPNGQFAPYNSPTISSTARSRRVVTLPTPIVQELTPRSPIARHTPLPGSFVSSPARSIEPSPLSLSLSLQSESPVVVAEDLPSDLEDALNQTLRPEASSSAEAEALPDLALVIKPEPSEASEHSREASPPFRRSWPCSRTPEEPIASIVIPTPILVRGVIPKQDPARTSPEPSPLLSIFPTGPASPPLGKAAASAMVVHSSETAARAAAIKALNAIGQFEDDGQPMKEAEYRRSFTFATSGCTDEDIAELWGMNLKYEGAAFYWYHQLTSSDEGKQAATKWSTLLPRIEERWNTPVIDLKAYTRRTRNEWDARTFDIGGMLDGLKDPGAPAKPHLTWASQHKALGLRIDTSNASRVADTLRILPPYLINLLPKTDQYDEDFAGLMADIGGLSSRRVLDAYETWTAVQSMQRLSFDHTHGSRSNPRLQNPTPTPTSRTRYASQPMHAVPQTQPNRHVHFVAPPAVSDRAGSLPPLQLLNPATAAQPVRYSSVPLQRPALRDPPPHVKSEPPPSPPRARSSSREPADRSATSRTTVSRPLGRFIEDTPEARQAHQHDLAEWRRRHPSGFAPLSDPVPLTPGTYEQTAELCVRCARENHMATLCDGPFSVNEIEREYRRRLAIQLRRAVTPARVFDQHLIDIDAEESDTEEFSYESGNDVMTEENRQWPMKVQVTITRGSTSGSKQVWGTVDGGAMLCVLDSVAWAQVEHFVGELRPSRVVCRMANGTRVMSMGTAEAEIEYRGHRWPIAFEVLDSRGAFELLIGKDWLNITGAKQDFLMDSVSLRAAGQIIYIENENPERPATESVPTDPIRPLSPVAAESETTAPPLQQTPSNEQEPEEQAEKLRTARLNRTPVPETRGLPVSPRPEERIPLEREDPTQPNNYQDEDSDDDSNLFAVTALFCPRAASCIITFIITGTFAFL